MNNENEKNGVDTTKKSEEKVVEAPVQKDEPILTTEDENTLVQRPKVVENPELKNLKKEYLTFKKSVVNHFLEKYQIDEAIDLKKLDFSNFENVEKSLLEHCEKKSIKYTSPVQKQAEKMEREIKNAFAKNKIYFY